MTGTAKAFQVQLRMASANALASAHITVLTRDPYGNHLGSLGKVKDVLKILYLRDWQMPNLKGELKASHFLPLT